MRRGDDDTLLALRWNEHGQGPRIPPRGWAMRHAHRRFGSPEERSPPRRDPRNSPAIRRQSALELRRTAEVKKCPRQSEHLPSTMPVLASSRALMPTWRSHPTPPSPASGRRGCHPVRMPVFPKRAAEFDVRFGRPKPIRTPREKRDGEAAAQRIVAARSRLRRADRMSRSTFSTAARAERRA